MENGVGWTGEFPFCEPVCSAVPKVDNAVVSCSSHTDLGSECTFVCEEGYELIGEGLDCILMENITRSLASQPSK